MEKLTLTISLIVDMIVGTGMAVLPISLAVIGAIIVFCFAIMNKKKEENEAKKKENYRIIKLFIIIEFVILLLTIICYIVGYALYKSGGLTLFMGFAMGAGIHYMLLSITIISILASIISTVVYLRTSKENYEKRTIRKKANGVILIMTVIVIAITVAQYLLLQYEAKRFW